jgi:hypothetical protein
MKRVSITFLPLKPVSIRARVLQTPPYTFINYATAANTQFLTKLLREGLVKQQFLINKSCEDITVFLTNLYLYILIGDSQIVNSIRSRMWTSTITIINNKNRFVTLITAPSKFAIKTTSRVAL